MQNFKSLGSGHLRLIKGEAVKPLEHVLDLGLSQQLLRELL